MDVGRRLSTDGVDRADRVDEVDRDDPSEAPTLVALLERACAQFGALPALQFGGGHISYQALDKASRALAAWLQDAGLVPGERVALLLPNGPAFVLAVLATWRAGGVVVPLDPTVPPRALRALLEDAGARTVVLCERGAAAFEPLHAVRSLPRVLVASRGELLGVWHRAFVNFGTRAVAVALPGAVRLGNALARGRRLALGPVALDGEAIAMLQYTGGIAAPPRAAVLRHRHLVANVEQCVQWLRPTLARAPAGEPLKWLCAMPLHQIFAFTLALLLPLRLGGSVLLRDDPTDARAIVRALARDRVNVLPATEPMFAAWLAEPECERLDWSALVLALTGGLAVPQATARRWWAATGCAITEGYGLAEASPAVTCQQPTPRGEVSVATGLGRPLPRTELRVVDEAGNALPAGHVGEIQVRGPQVMAGYWMRPDETARAMTADGYLRTGDLGQLDAQGQLHLVGRKCEMIVVSGFAVAPQEVEHVLGRLPGVRECAVVGVPDGGVGETVKAVLVKDDPTSARPNEADVRAWCETHLTGYKRPRIVEFRATLPRSGLGLPLRRALRDGSA